MILYRVMSKDELAAYLKGKNIKQPKTSDVALSCNSWKRPRVCFFWNGKQLRPLAASVLWSCDCKI